MKDLLSRRDALKALAIGAGSLMAAGAVAADAAKPAGAALPHLGVGEPTAMALGYVESTQGLDPKKAPTYKAGSKCSNCLQSKGKGNDGDAWIGCTLFPGKAVSAQGWCKAYVPRS